MVAAGVNWAVDETYTEGPAALLEAVKLAHERGNDVNAVNSMGVAAIHGAANRGANDVIEYLAANGARLDIADKQGRTPLDWAAGVFLATHPPVRKPDTIALLERLSTQRKTAATAALTTSYNEGRTHDDRLDEALRLTRCSPRTRRDVLRTASTLVAGATLARMLGTAARAQPPSAAAPPIARLHDGTRADERRRHDPHRQGRQGPAAAPDARRAVDALHVARRGARSSPNDSPWSRRTCAVMATAISRRGCPTTRTTRSAAMAQDQIDVMKHFGFDKFAVVGQDRGARVAHRMALDHADAVTKLVLIDIVPTHYLYTHVTIDFVQAYFHWFNYLQAVADPGESAARAAPAGSTVAAQPEYQRRNGTPDGVHSMCEDYRAGASIDLEHDGADFGKKLIRCPVNALWAEGGAMDKIYDVLAIWKSYAKRVEGKGMPGGHNMQEGAPTELLAELQRFLNA